MTPLYLITGFLGAGKTTLLRNMVPMLIESGIRPHIILNDYQNARVDAASFEEYTALVEPIAGTCVCCGSRDALFDALRSAPLTPESVMLIEANGTADATQLIEIFTADDATARYTLPIQIVVVDGKRWQKRHWNNRLERSQVETAGYGVLTRRDEVTMERSTEVLSAVEALAPKLTWTTPEHLTQAAHRLLKECGRLPPRRFNKESEPSGTHHRHRHHHHHAEHHFASMEVPLPARMPQADLEAYLKTLPPEVLRAKGMAYLDEEEFPIYFQRVDGSDSVSMKRVGVQIEFDPVAILIGVDIDPAKLPTLAPAG